MWHEPGFVLWFTGLPCSGKTTLSNAVKQRLDVLGFRAGQLDGDSVRMKYKTGLGYTKRDRMINIRHIITEASVRQGRGQATLVSVISPYRSMRGYARERLDGFVEAFVRCPLSVCEARDVKGMYRLARAGKIERFTGVSDPYEEPVDPELVLDTDRSSIEQCAAKVVAYLENRGFVVSPQELAHTGGIASK